jgi:hypothetical protein
MRPAVQATQPPVFVKRRKKGLAEEDEEREKVEASSKESEQES